MYNVCVVAYVRMYVRMYPHFFEWMNVWSFVCAHFIPRMAVWDSSLFVATSQISYQTSHQTYPTYVEWISIKLIWRGAWIAWCVCFAYLALHILWQLQLRKVARSRCNVVFIFKLHQHPIFQGVGICWNVSKMWFFLCACGVKGSLPQYQCRSRLDAGTLIESDSMPHIWHPIAHRYGLRISQERHLLFLGMQQHLWLWANS